MEHFDFDTPDTKENLTSPDQAGGYTRLHTARCLDMDARKGLIQSCSPEESLYKLKSQYLISSTQLCSSKIKEHKLAVIAYLSNEDAVQQSVQHLMEVSREASVYVCASDDKMYHAVQERCAQEQSSQLKLMRLEKNEASVLGQFAIDCEYVCFLHDAPERLSDLSGRVIQTEYYIIWENLLKNSTYVRNIADLFWKNLHIGLLFPPSPLHGSLLKDYSRRFQMQDPSVYVDLFHRLIYSAELCFWCRGNLFQEIVSGGQHQNQPYPDIAKNLGYAVGIVMNYDYGVLQLEKADIVLRKLLLEDVDETYHLLTL